MRRGIKATLQASVASSVIAGSLLLGATPAHAEVWGCSSWYDYGQNNAGAYCTSGNGYFRVGATCNRAVYPYSITVYGPWETAGGSRGSWVYGRDYSCYIVNSWVSV